MTTPKFLIGARYIKCDFDGAWVFSTSTSFITALSKRFITVNTNGCRFYSTRNETYEHTVKSAGLTPDIRPSSEIPCLRTLPFFGNFFSMFRHKDFDIKRTNKFFDAMVRDFGPVFKMLLPGIPTTVFFVQPEDIKKLLSETAHNPRRSGFHALKSIRDNDKGNFFQKRAGILSENDEEWKRVRTKVQRPIMNIPNIVTYLGTMDEVAMDFVERITEIRNHQQEVPEYFLQEIYKWALESVATVALNKRLGCLGNNLDKESYQMKLIDSVSDFLQIMQQIDSFPIWKLYPTKSYKKLKQCHDYIFKIANENVCLAEENLKQKSSSETNLTVLETYLRTEGLSRVDVVTFMTDLFIAGIDTTSHGISFTLYLLARNPEAQKTLQIELDNILGDGKEPMTPKQLSSMSYLKCCFKESMRLFPVVLGLARVFEKDTVINKYLIPKGWQGVGMFSIASQNESFFSQPTKFIPERWFKNKPQGAINPYASLPFSHGTRGCIGRRIAEQETYTLLARICHRFNVEYHYEDMDPLLNVVLCPDKPLKFKFTERR